MPIYGVPHSGGENILCVGSSSGFGVGFPFGFGLGLGSSFWVDFLFGFGVGFKIGVGVTLVSALEWALILE